MPPPPSDRLPRGAGRAALSVPLRAATAAPSRLPRPRPSGLLALVLAGSGGARMAHVPETAAQAAARRRRQVVATLRLAEAEARYAADQVGNGLDPQAAGRPRSRRRGSWLLWPGASAADPAGPGG